MAEYRIKLADKYWYYCGMTLPWYVSKGMVENELEKGGFSNFRWHERSDPLPSNVKPTKSPIYDDTWELWLEGVYNGPDGIGTLPAKPCWIMMVQPNAVKPSEPSISKEVKKPSPGSSAMTFVAVVLGVLGVALAARKGR